MRASVYGWGKVFLSFALGAGGKELRPEGAYSRSRAMKPGAHIYREACLGKALKAALDEMQLEESLPEHMVDEAMKVFDDAIVKALAPSQVSRPTGWVGYARVALGPLGWHSRSVPPATLAPGNELVRGRIAGNWAPPPLCTHPHTDPRRAARPQLIARGTPSAELRGEIRDGKVESYRFVDNVWTVDLECATFKGGVSAGWK